MICNGYLANYQSENSNRLSFCSALGTWMWLDRTVLDYTNWAADEPDSDFGNIATQDGTWQSGHRWHDRPFICKTPKGKIILLNNPLQKDRAMYNILLKVLIFLLLLFLQKLTQIILVFSKDLLLVYFGGYF